MIPVLQTSVPGPESLVLAKELREYESHNVTYSDADWPIFWERAAGVNVWDVDGNRYLDMTSAFGVAGLGHTHAELAATMRAQSAHLLHGMGDVHPTRLKSDLCRKLSEITWGRWTGEKAKVVLSNSGFEAVETALKTAVVATGRDGVLSFRDGYHGLGYGALLGGGMEKFRAPFSGQLAPVRQQLSFPSGSLDGLREELSQIQGGEIGAVLVEPIQGRGGKRVPPDGFLRLLREWCDANGAALIFDEIYSGFNRTGKLFACEYESVVPDLICVGKALSGGFPISACVGSAAVMDTWPVSPGEALHTSTFLGNPVGCAMALKALDLHLDESVAATVTETGGWLMSELRSMKYFSEVRGRGLMIGGELVAGLSGGLVMVEMMKRGYLMLADGAEGNVLAFTPPFAISRTHLGGMLLALSEVLALQAGN